jgi:hypothetical protein
VRYADLDHHRHDLPGLRGPRPVTDDTEWVEPDWRHHGFDCIDIGIEIETTAGRLFTVTWDSPTWAEGEGISLRETPLVGFAVVPHADIAVWDVTHRSNWSSYIGQTVGEITLHYRPSGGTTPPDDGFWCPHLTLTIAGSPIHIFLGTATYASDELSPSADTLAVVFPPNDLPDWVRT